MKITSVFLKESITWPATKYSGIVSFDDKKPGLVSMKWDPEDHGLYITVKAVHEELTTFVPGSNIKCINFSSGESYGERETQATEFGNIDGSSNQGDET